MMNTGGTGQVCFDDEHWSDMSGMFLMMNTGGTGRVCFDDGHWSDRSGMF